MNPIPHGEGGHTRPREFYWFYCSNNDLETDMPMVCKFKFVCYRNIYEKLALCVPRFNSEGPLKSEVSHLKKSPIGNRPSFHVLLGWYQDTPQEVAISVILGQRHICP